MMSIATQDNFAGAADDFYEALLSGHEGLSDEESAAMNARLILILANQIGDLAILREALAAARDAGGFATPALQAAG